MATAQKKVRSWCEDCEAWHPFGEHIAERQAESAPELRAEPRPVVATPRPQRGSNLLRLALFVFVILPCGIVAWSAAAYTVLQLLPQIRAALP